MRTRATLTEKNIFNKKKILNLSSRMQMYGLNNVNNDVFIKMPLSKDY